MSFFSSAEQKAIAIIPKISSSLSILGSSWIIIEIASDKSKWNKVYHRLMLMISITDAMMSLGCFLSTWPMPRDTWGVWGAIGTSRTCAAQGFLIQASFATGVYSTGLAIYYVLIIRYSMNDSELHRYYFERCVHIIAIIFSLGTSITAVVMDWFHPNVFWCWIAPNPADCVGNPSCFRDRFIWTVGYLFGFLPIWIFITIISICMAFVYSTVRQIERKSAKYNQRNIPQYNGHTASASPRDGNENDDRKKSRQVAIQAMLYIGAYLLVISFSTISGIILFFRDIGFGMILPQAILFPLLGFFNLFIYKRSQYFRLSRDQDIVWWKALVQSARHPRLRFMQQRKKEETNGNVEERNDVVADDETGDAAATPSASAAAAATAIDEFHVNKPDETKTKANDGHRSWMFCCSWW